MAILVVTEGPVTGQKFNLESHPIILLGRSDDCTFQLVDSRVSRKHLQLRRDEDGSHTLVHCSKSSWTYRNGAAVTDPVKLQDGDAADKERRLRFAREAKILASLSHPNSAAIHGLEEVDDQRFLILEYVPGVTLDERPAIERILRHLGLGTELPEVHPARASPEQGELGFAE